MDILFQLIGVDQIFISGKMGQHPQFDLGIICVHERISFLRQKHLPDGPSKFYSGRNILQVGLRAADPSGGCDRLVEFSVDSFVIADIVGQPVRIRRFQLGELSVLKNVGNNRI